jgi:hypothetical protein
MPDFTHLHVASAFSAHYGTARPEVLVAAQKAAEYLQCGVIVPEITDLCQSDFNDIHVFQGLEEVKRQCLASTTS